MFYRIVPLSAGFMLTSICGFLVTIFFVYPNVSSSFFMRSLAFAILLFFVMMFIASIISMTYAPIEADLDIKQEKKRVTKKSKYNI